MKIKRMTATFGGLTEQRLELAPGLNLIQAPNESGKSTWAGFLKAMLYGIDTRDRDKKGHLADKNRYQPWSGAPMEGELLLEWQGRDITIRRGPRGSVPFGNFSAVYTGTEESVPGLTADTCGELLLGVGREVFERSAFIGQGGSLTVTATPELERRIAALVSSGQEDVSFSQAEARLKEWLNRRRVNRSVGRIPQLEEALAQTADAREEAEQVNDEVNRLSAERADLAHRTALLETELGIHKALARRELNRKFRQAQAELAQATAEQESLRQEQARFLSLPDREELKRAQGELALLKALDPEIRQGAEALTQAEAELEQARARAVDQKFPGMTGDEAVQKAEKDVAEHQRWTERGRQCRKQVPMLQLAGAAAAALIAAGGMMAGDGLFPWIWLAMAAYGVLAAASIFSLSAGKKADAAGRRVLERYGVQGPDEVIALARAYRERTAAADRAAQQVRLVRSALSERQARRENTHTDLFQFVHSFAPEVKDLFGCSAALSLALNLEERGAVAAARLNGARRLYEALKAQGGREEPENQELRQPVRTLEETAAQLGIARAELERAERQLNMALGRQKAVGDPAALAVEKEALARELERREGEYQAISAAMEGLKAANAQLQERFSPELNRRAAYYLSRLTGGRYREVSLDRELDASAMEGGGVLPRRALFLSKGTVDQIYLAVRLAVYDLCLKERQAPLVLDDALAAFDDERMALALDLLAWLAEDRQILLFTCQGREAAGLAGRSGVTIQSLPART
ncbi:MAG: AAA family ATPase [Oscillospiraceae bacterium]|jgi:hypothetical protein|nr:AAA family ATPase [Oscillospiraceae bacterium]